MPLRKNRGVLIEDGRLKPGLQRGGPSRKNRLALAKRDSSASSAPSGRPRSRRGAEERDDAVGQSEETTFTILL